MTNTKVAVLLGAGASYDAWNETGPPQDVNWRPPLARELFGARPAFWNVLQHYPGAVVLASELGELARGNEFNIERKLREYAEHRDERVRRHFKQIPPYLRHLILQVVHTFTGGQNPGTHLRLVLSLLSRGFEAAFVDLNYDPYIEMALAWFDPALTVRAIGDYVAPGRQAIVCKVHGSIDWGTPMGPAGQSWLDVVNAFDVSGRGDVVFNNSRTPSVEFHAQDGRTLLYPRLTAPLAGKGNVDLVCPRSHLDALQAFLDDCQCYLVIGTSGQDEDVLGFLAQCAQRIRVVHYVSENAEIAKTVEGRIGAVCLAFRKAKHPAYYGQGFRWYVGDPLFEEFLTKAAELEGRRSRATMGP